MRVLGVSRYYRERPSRLMAIQDEYTAYCFDEACAVIQYKREVDKVEPRFWGDAPAEIKHYSTPSEMYKAMGA